MRTGTIGRCVARSAAKHAMLFANDRYLAHSGRPESTYCGRSRPRPWTPQLGREADLAAGAQREHRDARKRLRVLTKSDSIASRAAVIRKRKAPIWCRETGAGLSGSQVGAEAGAIYYTAPKIRRKKGSRNLDGHRLAHQRIGMAPSASRMARKPGSEAMTALKPYSEAVFVAASSAPPTAACRRRGIPLR